MNQNTLQPTLWEAEFLHFGVEVYRRFKGKRHRRYQRRKFRPSDQHGAGKMSANSCQTTRRLMVYSRHCENLKPINICAEEFCLLGYNSTDVSH
jgi:hypothetical protein